MGEPIIYIDRSDVRDGKLDELQIGVAKLVEFIGAHEPQLLSYGFYFDAQGTRMTVIAVHPDSASIETHMEIGTPEFRKLADFIILRGIEVYGQVSDTVLMLLRQKAEMLGDGGAVRVDQRHAGFTRLSVD